MANHWKSVVLFSRSEIDAYSASCLGEILGRRHAGFLAEEFGEVLDALEAEVPGDFRQRELRVLDQAFGLFEAQLVHVGDGGRGSPGCSRSPWPAR